MFEVKQNIKNSNTGWLLTFADLLSLILVFFVLLYSMADVEDARWEKVVESFKQSFSASQTLGRSEGMEQLGIEKEKVSKSINLDYLYSVLVDKKNQDPFLNKHAQISLLQNKLVLSFDSLSLFDPFTNKASSYLEVSLAKLIQVLQGVSNAIEVNCWIQKPQGSNGDVSVWKKSLIRAREVSELLKTYGQVSKVTVTAGPITSIEGQVDSQTKVSKDFLNIIIYDGKKKRLTSVNDDMLNRG